ncbi:MAG: MFS transporter [Candidatus Riflebacteria bacterium]|nr:MFS transporter [Candidatus Riflebacteria bacterium]
MNENPNEEDCDKQLLRNSLQMPKPSPLFSNVVLIGWISFFGGISQDLILPILPLYLANALHMDKAFIGLVEGIVTSSASIFKIVAGYLSDRFRKRKALVFLGYSLSMIGRFFLAVVTMNLGILFLRFLDGVGKGVKDSPKDALMADSTEQKTRGKSFGIQRMLDTLGSVVGPIVLFFLLSFWEGNDKKYQYLFYSSAIPLFATLFILVFFVRETSTEKKSTDQPSINPIPTKFFAFLGIMTLFNLGNSSDAFLILRAQNVGVTLLKIPLIYALFNFVYAAASIPLGSLSDKIGREKVIILGWGAYSLAYLGFGLANQTYQIWLLFAFYGIYYATTEGVAKAFIADIIPAERRGTAYGIYNTVNGLITLPASLIAGYLWDTWNPSTPFFFGAAMAAISTISMFIFIKKMVKPALE